MTRTYFSIIPCVSLIMLRDDDSILFLRRFQTGFADGMYALPGGGVDGKETFKQAACREAMEEVGVLAHPENLQLVQAIHHYRTGETPETDKELVQFFFLTRIWSGEPFNKEPDKHDTVGWFKRTDLPEKMLPWTRDLLVAYPNNPAYVEEGW